ncbi:MAG: hypothetical protein ACP6IY_09365 [Promethearchaeia archaeon]
MNKIKLKLIQKLKNSVNSKEEYNYLIKKEKELFGGEKYGTN